MTDDERLLAGERARRLLSDQMFLDALGGFMNMHLSALIATGDDDAEGRERHFRKYRAFEGIAADLRECVSQADAITAERESPADPTDLDQF